MLHPREVGVARRRHAVLPALVVGEAVAAPVGDVEGRIGEDVVGLEVRVAVVVEAVAVRDLPLDAPECEVHLREPPGRVVGLLAVDRDVGAGVAAVAVPGGVGVDERLRLHEHARRAAARVVDAAAVGLEHLDEQPDDVPRRVELTGPPALGGGEAREEVLVDAPEHVPRAGVRVADGDVADEVDQLPEPPRVQRGTSVVLR